MERALTIPIKDLQMLGILHQPETCAEVGVVLIVGGPQYRVGSHRQFVQLARALAREGIACLRFDYRGMGDSEGEKQSFEDIDLDIAAACDAFSAETGIHRIVLWGLCDAASAAMIYAPTDPRISGLVLLNPWLRSEAAMGKTMVRHYYLRRLLSIDFWRKLLRGKVNMSGSLQDLGGFVHASREKEELPENSYQARMQAGLNRFRGQICLILSGSDLTAREFEQQALEDTQWAALEPGKARVHRLPKADHTFSSADFKAEVEALTCQYIASLVTEDQAR